MKIISSFKPKGLLKNRHLQTILTQYLYKKSNFEYHKENFELSDGDFLELFYSGDLSKGIVLIMHGILGEMDSHYTHFTFEVAHELGLGVVFISARGSSSKVINRKPQFFNAADAKDLNEVIRYLKACFPVVPLFALGFSLGGITLTKWLAENNQENLLTAAMVTSIPFDLAYSTELFKRYPGKFYSNFLIRNIRKKLLMRFKYYYQGLIDIKQLKKVKNFPQLDELVAPINGYASAQDYYLKGSPKYFLKRIKSPLLIVHALDDPFTSPEIIPQEDELSESVILELTEYGGHLGFIERIKRFKAEYWLKHRIKEFLKQYLNL